MSKYNDLLQYVIDETGLFSGSPHKGGNSTHLFCSDGNYALASLILENSNFLVVLYPTTVVRYYDDAKDEKFVERFCISDPDFDPDDVVFGILLWFCFIKNSENLKF